MDRDDFVLTTRIARRFLANFYVQCTKDKLLRKRFGILLKIDALKWDIWQ